MRPIRNVIHVIYHLMPEDWKETHEAFCGLWLPRRVTAGQGQVTYKRCQKKMAAPS